MLIDATFVGKRRRYRPSPVTLPQNKDFVVLFVDNLGYCMGDTFDD